MIGKPLAAQEHPFEATERTPLLPGGSLLAKCRIIIICSLGQGTLAYNTGCIGFVFSLLEGSSLSPSAQGAIASALLIGVICGQALFGIITDLLGPKLAGLMSTSCAICGVCITTSAGVVAPLEVQLTVGRFIIGIGAGAEWPISASLSASIKSNVDRRTLLIAASILQCASVGLAYLILFPMLCLNAPGHVIWRCLLAGGGLPCLLCFFLRLGLDPTELRFVPSTESYGHELTASLKGKKLQFFSLCCGWALQMICSSSQTAYAPLILQDMQGSAESTDFAQVVLSSFWMWVLSCCFFCYLRPISDYMTLKGATVSFALCAALLLVLCAISLQHAWTGLTVLSFIAASAITLLPGALFFAIAGEMFDASTVGFYMGIAAFCAKGCSALAQAVCPALLDHYGLALTFYMFSACMFGSFLSAKCLPGSRRHDDDAKVAKADKPFECSIED